MKINLSKFILLSGLSLGIIVGGVFSVNAGLPSSMHSNVFAFSNDAGTTVSRLISTAVKYFLSDDTDMEAQLVWKDGSSCGGCGGCYGGSCNAGAKTGLSAVLSDISIETDMYQGEAIAKTCVADLAQQRLDASVNMQAALDDLNEHEWHLQYQSQRRAIQAMTDALNMKRIYNELKDVATSTPNDYSNYSAAMSSVASKRLLLDQLLALKKRVIAARLRTRAQTLDVNAPDLQRITVAPDLTEVCEGDTEGGNPPSQEDGAEDNDDETEPTEDENEGEE